MGDSTVLLDQVSSSQSAKEIVVNALTDASSGATLYGRHASTCVGLTWGYYGGWVPIASVPTHIANGTVALTASTTNYVRKLDSTGVVFVTTSIPGSWPGLGGGYTPLYDVVTSSTAATSWNDYRGATLFTAGTGAAPSGSAGGGLTGTYPNPTVVAAGSTTQIQYNSSNALAADSRLTFDATNKVAKGQFTSDSSAINAQTGTSYTLAATDNGAIVTMNNGSASSLFIPENLDKGFSCIIIQIGAGQVTIAPGGSPGPTLRAYNSALKLTGQYAAASVIAYVANVFNVSGNLTT